MTAGPAPFLNNPYIIELLTPKQEAPNPEADLTAFHERYQKIRSHRGVVSICDNPMGNLHYTALEVLSYLNLAIEPEAVLIHLNTFHRKVDLDDFLAQARAGGLKYLLVVSGDGGPRLPRLDPRDVGMACETVTSVELLRYIHAKHPGVFTCGVAFNHYEPMDHELAKLQRKIDAGAQFVITQPVIGKDANVYQLASYQRPWFIGAWMSKRIDLLYECVGIEQPLHAGEFDPVANLMQLHKDYPQAGLYLSLLGFKREWAGLFPRQTRA